jgi:DeoR/GlpR family transcriptional regulator of sugar metabolism
MLVDERRHLIAESVLAQGAATVADLSDRFGVTPVTIRSDLVALEEQGILTRNRGGAVANRVLRFTPAFQQQTSVNREAKKAIAAATADLIQDGDRVILDAGSTTLFLADLLCLRRLTIAVNSVYSMNKLIGAPNVELIVIGGILFRPALSFVGELAESYLDRLHFDKAILGVNGLSEHGISVNNPAEAGIKRRMIVQSDQVIVLADASKISIDSLVRIDELNRIDTVVTDSPVSAAARKRLGEAHPNLEVIVA